MVHRLECLLQSRQSVLVVGEPACGKTTAWQLLHQALRHAPVAAGGREDSLDVQRVRAASSTRLFVSPPPACSTSAHCPFCAMHTCVAGAASRAGRSEPVRHVISRRRV